LASICIITNYVIKILKPLELATQSERSELIAQRQETINFFKEMESNINNKILEYSQPNFKITTTRPRNLSADYNFTCTANMRLDQPRRVRTLSAMDGK
jgi:stalled ribosome rescue protein Dom34